MLAVVAGSRPKQSQSAGGSVTAIDASPEMLKTAKLHALESGLTIDYVESHAEELVTSHAAAFDVVTCFEMIEHVPEPMETLKALAALVRPGGWLILSTINRTPKSISWRCACRRIHLELGAKRDS